MFDRIYGDGMPQGGALSDITCLKALAEVLSDAVARQGLVDRLQACTTPD